ncbi:MAG: M81 family metallopeptidase [Pseudomonadota bacterium]
MPPVPLVFGWCQPWGPADQKFFDYMVDEMIRRMEANCSVDAVFVANQNAMVATGNPDPDADMLERLRQAVGQTFQSSEHWIFTPTSSNVLSWPPT